jgi:GTP-binding protein EngB required for normal cell division/uncharacterized protein (DUF697 family)
MFVLKRTTWGILETAKYLILRVERNSTNMEPPFITQFEPTKGSDEALIIVRGFRGEGNFRKEIADYWMLSIREIGWRGSVYYLWWDASDPDNFNNILAVPKWKKSKDRAKRVGTIYFKHLVEKEVPEKSISLIGHSLGARVIYYALKECSSTTQEIKDVILLGGAIRENKDWQYVASNLSGRIFNLYNSKDPVLKTTYKIGEFFLSSDPCGLVPIEKHDSKIINLNVESMVEKSHSELSYLHALKKNKFKIWREDDGFTKTYDTTYEVVKNEPEEIEEIKEVEETASPKQVGNDAENLYQKLEEIENTQVSVAVFGQPGAGKSSLINCLTGRNQAQVGNKNDITVEEKSYEWNGLYLVDLPGYGTSRFPSSSYMKKFNIKKFDFFLCVFSGVRLKEDDIAFFKKLNEIGKNCLFVCNKTDTLWEDGKTLGEIQKEIQENLTQEIGVKEYVYFTSCRKKEGLDELTKDILKLLGNVSEKKKERWAMAAKAYSPDFLREKKKACQKYIIIAAGASAANGANPVPGLDFAIDMGILVSLLQKIRSYYDLDENQLNAIDVEKVPQLSQMAKKVVKYATKDGALLLIRKFMGRSVAKQASKWIPLVGAVVAGSIGFATTSSAGNSYLDDCSKLAEAMLEKEID